jgi:hypothetical protein
VEYEVEEPPTPLGGSRQRLPDWRLKPCRLCAGELVGIVTLTGVTAGGLLLLDTFARQKAPTVSNENHPGDLLWFHQDRSRQILMASTNLSNPTRPDPSGSAHQRFRIGVFAGLARLAVRSEPCESAASYPELGHDKKSQNKLRRAIFPGVRLHHIYSR